MSPGEKLPSDRQFADEWGISIVTVRRVLSSIAEKGMLVRFQGKGTFIPGIETNKTLNPSEQPGSSKTIIQQISQSIAKGEIKSGEALPAIKTISMRYRIKKASVVAAYKELESDGLVTKVGRKYWVGPFDMSSFQQGLKEICFIGTRGTDFSQLYVGRGRSLLFRSIEKNLLKAGFTIRYISADQTLEYLQKCLKNRRYPSGFILAYMTQEEYDVIRKSLSRIIHSAGKGNTRILMISGPSVSPLLKGTCQLLTPGNTFTTFCRTLGNFIHNKRHKNISFFYDFSGPNFRSFGSHMKIRVELKHFNPNTNFSFVIRCTDKSQTKNSIWKRYFNTNREKVTAILSKFTPTSPEELKEEIIVVDDFTTYFKQSVNSCLWLFADDANAASALQWTKKYNIRVPEQVSIIGLQNDPAYYHLGITSCEEDWDTIGYLCAHALTGDMPIARTHKGYIRPSALVLERFTT